MNSKHLGKCPFALNLILFLTFSNLHSISIRSCTKMPTLSLSVLRENSNTCLIIPTTIISCRFRRKLYKTIGWRLPLWDYPSLVPIWEILDKPLSIVSFWLLHEISDYFVLIYEILVTFYSSGSRPGKGGPRNITSMRPPLVAIFFMTYFHRAGGGHGPLGPPPGSASVLYSTYIHYLPAVFR